MEKMIAYPVQVNLLQLAIQSLDFIENKDEKSFQT